MNKKEELFIKIDKILHVYIFAQDAYLYTEYFHNPKTEEELKFVTSSAHARQFSVIMHLMFRTVVIEVSKLFSRSDSDKFQIEKFVRSLSSDGHFREIGISFESIKNWQQRLELNRQTIDDILLLRDKLYAHTDNPLDNYNEVDISFKKIKELLDIAKDILTDIYKTVFSMGLLTESPSFDRNRFGILQLLAKAEANRIQEIFNKYKNLKP